MKMNLLFSLLLLASTLTSSLARVLLQSLVPPSEDFNNCSSARHLLEDNESRAHTSVDLAQGYMTNADLERAIKEFGQRCSNISRIYSIGKSVKGVPLWVIEISDKPGEEETEPAFKYIGNVHGDEPVGRELLMFLANWLCDNHLKDPLATLIVENVHLHLLPSINPDGFSLRRRNNANNIDLNRDFPDQVCSGSKSRWKNSLEKVFGGQNSDGRWFRWWSEVLTCAEINPKELTAIDGLPEGHTAKKRKLLSRGLRF